MFKINKKMMSILASIVISFTCLVPMTAAGFASDAINITLDTSTLKPTNYCYYTPYGGSTVLSCNWTCLTNIVAAGKGWTIGSANRVLNYNASFSITGNNGCAYLGCNGWTKNPLVEYYVTDSWFNFRPVYGASKGQVSSDGGTYDIYKNTQVNMPSINGTATFDQFWSVRQSQRMQGSNNTITFTNHVNAWKSKGMSPGNIWDYQVIAVDYYQSSGNICLTIW